MAVVLTKARRADDVSGSRFGFASTVEHYSQSMACDSIQPTGRAGAEEQCWNIGRATVTLACALFSPLGKRRCNRYWLLGGHMQRGRERDRDGCAEWRVHLHEGSTASRLLRYHTLSRRSLSHAAGSQSPSVAGKVREPNPRVTLSLLSAASRHLICT